MLVVVAVVVLVLLEAYLRVVEVDRPEVRDGGNLLNWIGLGRVPHVADDLRRGGLLCAGIGLALHQLPDHAHLVLDGVPEETVGGVEALLRDLLGVHNSRGLLLVDEVHELVLILLVPPVLVHVDIGGLPSVFLPL